MPKKAKGPFYEGRTYFDLIRKKPEEKPPQKRKSRTGAGGKIDTMRLRQEDIVRSNEARRRYEESRESLREEQREKRKKYT